MEKLAIIRLNRYLENSDTNDFDKYCSLMHPAFPLMSPEMKEKALIDTLSLYPETVAYAMLRLSIRDIDVKDFFKTEYRSSLEGFIEDTETGILIAFGDVELFLTYARMYIIGMNGFTEKLKKRLLDRFSLMKCEREYDEYKNRPAFKQ